VPFVWAWYQTQTLVSPAAAWYFFYLFEKNVAQRATFFSKRCQVPPCRRRIGRFFQVNTWCRTDRVSPVNHTICLGLLCSMFSADYCQYTMLSKEVSIESSGRELENRRTENPEPKQQAP